MTDLQLWLLIAALSVVFSVLLGKFIHTGMSEDDDSRYTEGAWEK